MLKDGGQTWQEWLEGFGLPTYDESTVPEDATLPRITYQWAETELDAPTSIPVSLWYRAKGWKDITQKAEEFFDGIGYGGKTIKTNDGYLWVLRGSPFYQRVTDEDDGIRRIVLNITVEHLRT